MYIILTLLLGIAAVNTGNNLIYLIVAALLSFLIVSGLLGRHNLKSLRGVYKIPDEIYAGSQCPIFFHLHNDRKRHPAFLLSVFLSDANIFIPFIPPQGAATAMVNWRCEKRGIQPLPDAYIASPYPFNFFIRYKAIHDADKVIVFPQPLPGEPLKEANIGGREQGAHDARIRGGEGEIISIRDYQPGDNLRFINWKASARTGKLKSMDLGMSIEEPLLLDFDLLPGRDDEKKLSYLCYLIKNTIKDMRPVGLKLGGIVYNPGQTREYKLKLLKALALYEMEKPAIQN